MSDSNEQAEISVNERRTVFENSKFHVFADHISDEGGREIKDYLVVAPKVAAVDLITGVTILPVWNDSVVLLKTFRHAVRRTVLEAPRGFVDSGETVEEAALRELAEETGLVCLPDRLIALGTCIPEAGLIAARVALFAALDCRKGAKMDTDEIGLGNCVNFSFAAAEQLARDMILEDATTSLSLHRFLSIRAASGNQPQNG